MHCRDMESEAVWAGVLHHSRAVRGGPGPVLGSQGRPQTGSCQCGPPHCRHHRSVTHLLPMWCCQRWLHSTTTAAGVPYDISLPCEKLVVPMKLILKYAFHMKIPMFQLACWADRAHMNTCWLLTSAREGHGRQRALSSICILCVATGGPEEACRSCTGFCMMYRAASCNRPCSFRLQTGYRDSRPLFNHELVVVVCQVVEQRRRGG